MAVLSEEDKAGIDRVARAMCKVWAVDPDEMTSSNGFADVRGLFGKNAILIVGRTIPAWQHFYSYAYAAYFAAMNRDQP